MSGHDDVDREETREWLEALDAVVEHDGPERAMQLLESVFAAARRKGLNPARDLTTPYVNTISVDEEPEMPGDPDIERSLQSLMRWNATVMVLRANKPPNDLGGHIASYASAAVLYETGFNHFWHAPTEEHGGDLVYIQGHSSPGIYARMYLEGRLDEDDVGRFRQEVGEGPGLASYPHPWLMPDLWQFPTVSMGLTPLMAIYQARFMQYLKHRGLAETEGRKVWAFMGDGEMDEPESLGAISLAGREKLDNLVYVINCNLQRLDGPVRGNGKIIQELESIFRGAGWNVIKVIWGTRWDPLLADDDDGRLLHRMEEALDGDYQTYKSRDGAYVREHFFGADPELAKRVEDMSDEEIWQLNRGGLDPVKVYAAYKAAQDNDNGQPTVILAKTIKGYGMGEAGEGQMVTHQAKKMAEDALFAFRDRFELDVSDDEVKDLAFYKPADDSPEMTYLREHREALGGSLPQRRREAGGLPVPDLDRFKNQLEGTGDRENSTTMAFVRILATLVRDKELGPHIVPIVADESRTFGMEGMFRQIGIYSPVGQLYTAQDSEQLMSYREEEQGQILEEGITEAGAISSWIAAATSYSNHGVAMLPVYIFYSMFGFQRVGDFIWAAADQRARGFLIGGTAGRTTLNGEGLQHEDGHSHLVATTVPNCVAYDPAYAYEVAVIVQDGLRRMYGEREDVFYYITVMNENYRHPPMPKGAEEGIIRGMHRIAKGRKAEVQLLGAGTILREVEAAAELLSDDFGVTSDVFSVTSFSELARDGAAVERRNRLKAPKRREKAWVEKQLDDRPAVVATDYIRAVGEQIRAWVPGPYTVLGTDGFGRSDSRDKLRRFFEVDRHHVVVAALRALGRDDDAEKAIKDYEIDVDGEAPWRR